MAEVATGHVYSAKNTNIKRALFLDGVCKNDKITPQCQALPVSKTLKSTAPAMKTRQVIENISNTDVPPTKSHTNHVKFQHTYKVMYLGYAVLDRKYTLPMLPWLIAEIKRHGSQNVEEIYLEVTKQSLKAANCENNDIVFEHKLQTISKFAQSSHDPSCFTYMTREVENGPSAYHVFQACDENTVLELFTAMREMTKEMSSQLNSVPPVIKTATGVALESILNNSRQYEVLYLGRIKVSGKRAPPAFIDDAVEKFRLYEMEKSRNQSNGRQRHGSGSCSFSLPYDLEAIRKSEENESRSVKSSDRNENWSGSNGEISVECNDKCTDVFRHANCDSYQEPFLESPLSPLCSDRLTKSPSLDQALAAHSRNLHTKVDTQFSKDLKNSESKCQLIPPSSLIFHTQSLDVPGCAYIVQDLQEIDSDVVHRDRVRSCSGDIPRTKQTSLPLFRNRVGSGGNNDFVRPRSYTTPVPFTNRQKNRVMLFLIGNMEICLIGMDKRQMLLTKTFSDIAHCSQGIRHLDHFGFICRETSLAGADCYAGYIFRCETEKVVDEMMHSLKQAFSRAHQTYQSLNLKNSLTPKIVLCDTCPMHWFHKLCCQTEGLTPEETHLVIHSRLGNLPDTDKEEIIVKFQNEDFSDIQEQNEVLMMLLREYSEQKQMNHVHTLKSGQNFNKNQSVFMKDRGSRLDALCQKAKKSLSSSLSSFETLLKFSDKEEDESTVNSGLHTTSAVHDFSCSPQRDASTPVKWSSTQEPSQGHRPRSSTLGSSRELTSGNHSFPDVMGSSQSSFLYDTPVSRKSIKNLFMKSTDADASRTDSGLETPKSSWRKTIFHKAQTPKKDYEENLLEEKSFPVKKSSQELRELWRRAIMDHILLIRMEKENKKLQASQDAALLKRVKLDYNDVTIATDTVASNWEDILKCQRKDILLSDVEDLVKKGVPRHKRGEIWLYISKMKRKVTFDESESYENILKKLTCHGHAILNDIGRTFPDHPYFSQNLGSGQLALFNILKAYSLLDEEVGYCQGLGFIAGIFLLHMEEYQAFLMLKFIMYDLGIRRQYKDELIAFQVQMYQLSRLLHDNHKDLYDHLEKYDIPPVLYATPWFLTLFTSVFPIGFVARIFDFLIVHGMEVILKTSVLLLKCLKDKILQTDNFESTMTILKSNVRDLPSSDMATIIEELSSLDISRELHAYEVEYHVLQDEINSPSKYNEEFEKIFKENKMLKSRNMELTEQLSVAYTTIEKLKASEVSLKNTIKILNKQIKSLEEEKSILNDNLKIMKKNSEKFEQSRLEKISEEHTPSFEMVYAMAGTEKEEDIQFKKLIKDFTQEFKIVEAAAAGDSNCSDVSKLKCEFEEVSDREWENISDVTVEK